MRYPVTPDGRYFVVRGREAAVKRLMAARRAVSIAKRAQDEEALRAAREAVDEAKRDLGERGPVWWTDGAEDVNQRMARSTRYSDWYASLTETERENARPPNTAP